MMINMKMVYISLGKTKGKAKAGRVKCHIEQCEGFHNVNSIVLHVLYNHLNKVYHLILKNQSH